MRLNKYLAQAGLGSRRGSELLIREGRVSVNGGLVTNLGVTVDPLVDVIAVDHNTVRLKATSVYVALNKPPGYVTTVTDPFNRPTVMDLVRNVSEGVVPIGRLDMDTEGLLLLSNDGELAHFLTHPRFGVEKEYHAVVMGSPTQNALEQLENGLLIEDRITAPAKARLLTTSANQSLIELVVYEGRKRQIRLMCEAVGHPVITLKRVRIGPIQLGNLPTGRWRPLASSEFGELLHQVREKNDL